MAIKRVVEIQRDLRYPHLEKVMTLQLVKSALLAAVVSTSLSAFAGTGETRYWLHPKLGLVKLQASTRDAVTADVPLPVAPMSVAAVPAAKSAADKCKARYWVAPKGQVSRLMPKGCEA